MANDSVEELVKTPEPDEKAEHADIYTEDGAVRGDFLAMVGAAIADRDVIWLRRNVGNLHISELGDVLEAILAEQRSALVNLLGEDFDLAALTEVDEAIRLEIVDQMPNEAIAAALSDLDSDDAVYILEDLDLEDREEILAQLPFTERVRLRRALDYPESSAGRRMRSEFVAVPPFWSVGQCIDYMREEQDLPESFTEIFVIDPTFKLMGVVDLDRILRTKRAEKVEEIMRETNHPVPADMDQEEAAQLFEQYDLLSAAVVDENGRLVGVLTIDDVVDVIHEEADEDIKRLAGVGDEELSDNVMSTVRSRFLWLFINMGTAFLSSTVIGLFGATIQQMIALAALMPIVSAIGGNAGTQTMTVTVRALSSRDLDIYNAGRVVRRELGVGATNGLMFGTLVGTAATLLYGDYHLGLVIGIALFINFMAAALAGNLLPLILNRFGADPAVASAVFVTMITDLTGFFCFLGLATLWFSFR